MIYPVLENSNMKTDQPKQKQEAACLRIAEQFEIQISHILLATHISQSISTRRE
jgi:hypothetical protein